MRRLMRRSTGRLLLALASAIALLILILDAQTPSRRVADHQVCSGVFADLVQTAAQKSVLDCLPSVQP